MQYWRQKKRRAELKLFKLKDGYDKHLLGKDGWTVTEETYEIRMSQNKKNKRRMKYAPFMMSPKELQKHRGEKNKLQDIVRHCFKELEKFKAEPIKSNNKNQ